MIKNFQKVLNALHVVLDAAVTAAAYLLAYYFQFHILNNSLAPLSAIAYMKLLWVIVPLYVCLYAVFRLYQPKRVMGRRLEAGNVLTANTVGILLITLGLYLQHEQYYSRWLLFYFTIINTGMLVAERNCMRYILRRARKNGFNQKHVLLIGYSRAAEGFIDRVRKNPYWGYQIRGILDDALEFGHEYKGIRVIGNIKSLPDILALNRMDEIIITLSLDEYSKLGAVVKHCEKSGVHTKFVPDYNNIIPTQPYTEDLLGLPMIHIRHVPLSNPFNQIVKRTMDIVGGAFALLLFSPVMLVTAVMIKLTSPGPLLYKQERVGLHNRTFYMYKFRSMEVQEEQEEQGKWTTKDDPRITKIGKFIRKTSIDEMPQLFNVLRGEMSLVGPRPERPFFVEKFKEEIPRYMVKHQVRPGMTGWAQVNGLRGDTSIRDRIDYDLYYIENWTLLSDIKILFLTIFKGFINKNAY